MIGNLFKKFLKMNKKAKFCESFCSVKSNWPSIAICCAFWIPSISHLMAAQLM